MLNLITLQISVNKFRNNRKALLSSFIECINIQWASTSFYEDKMQQSHYCCKLKYNLVKTAEVMVKETYDFVPVSGNISPEKLVNT